MNRTAVAALVAALAAGPVLAQAVTEDTDVIVVDPDATPEVVAPGAEAVPVEEATTGTEVIDVDPAEVEVIETDPAMAETEMATGATTSMDGMIAGDDITGGPIYSTGEAYDAGLWDSGEPYAYDAGYETIGDIEDIVLDVNGQMVGVVAEVGGFLGLGSKDVLLPLDDVRLVSPDGADYAYVTRLTEDQLTDLPAIEEGLFD